MRVRKLIYFLYLLYTIYVLIILNITDLQLMFMLPSLLFLWLMYLLFYIGSRRVIKIKNKSIISKKHKPFLLKKNKFFLILLAAITVVFSLLATNYYTGQTPISIIQNLIAGNSLYSQYQVYFALNDISTFSLEKVPFIFMMFFIKLNLFISYLTFFIYKKKLSKFDYFYLFCITISQVFFSFARGTSFELFEITLLIVYILSIKSKNYKKLLKNILKIVVVISIMLYIFFFNTIARGNVPEITFTPEISHNAESFVSVIFPTLALISSGLFAYFGFGFYYIASFINYIWLNSFKTFFFGLIPMGFRSFYGLDLIALMKNTIVMGPRWHPDAIKIINGTGLLGLLLACLLLGVISNISLSNNSKSKNELEYLFDFMILLQMFSMPIGNFVFISSANQLVVMLLLVYYFWKILIKKRIVLYKT